VTSVANGHEVPRGLTPLDQYAIAGAAAAVPLIVVYWRHGIASLVVSSLACATVTSVGYVRARKTPGARRRSEGQSFTRSSVLPLIGFAVFYGGVILIAAGLAEAVDRNLPDDGPVELGALVGGGMAGALIGISLGARIARRRGM
jgi:hypothetical protein